MDDGVKEQVVVEVKRSKRFFWIFLVVLVAGLVVMATPRFMAYWKSKKALDAYNQYLEVFLNDNIGGATPEETLKMFAEALRAGDAEKASTYFALDSNGSREKWLKFLEESRHDYSKIINSLETMKRVGSPEFGRVWFEGFYEGEEELMLFVENNKIWKIESL